MAGTNPGRVVLEVGKALGLQLGGEKMKKSWLMLVVLSFVIVGCSSGSSAEIAGADRGVVGGSMAPGESAAPAVGGAQVNLNRQVIRNGSMTVRVTEVEKFEKSLVADLTAIGGYVASSESAGYGGRSPSATLDLRVPSVRLDEFIATLSGYGVVLSKQLSSEDVTDQLIDIGARLKTLRAQEDKYRGLVAKMTKISEIHELETRLGEIRTEIERISATQKSMMDRATLSELKVTLTQDSLTTVAAASTGNWFGESWGQSTGAFVGFLKTAGSAAIWLLVWSPVWGVFAGGAVWLSRRQVRSKA